MAVQIVGYRVSRWLNQKTNEAMYGVEVRLKGRRDWIGVAEGSKAVLFDHKTQAEQYIVGMKAERDKDGFKKAA